MNNEINNLIKQDKKRTISKSKIKKYITVQRIKCKNPKVEILSNKEKKDKIDKNMTFFQEKNRIKERINKKRKTISNTNIHSINKKSINTNTKKNNSKSYKNLINNKEIMKEKNLDKPSLYSIDSYCSIKLKNKNKNNINLTAAGTANKNKIDSNLTVSSSTTAMATTSQKGKIKSKINCNRATNTTNKNDIKNYGYNVNFNLLNHFKKNTIIDKENFNPNKLAYNTISINRNYKSFMVKKNKNFNNNFRNENNNDYLDKNKYLNLEKDINLKKEKEIIKKKNKDNSNNTNDYTIIIRKNNSALLTFGNTNNDSLSESLSKLSNNKYLLILKQENENLKNELMKTKEKVDVLENKIENLIIYGKTDSSSNNNKNKINPQPTPMPYVQKFEPEDFNTINNKSKSKNIEIHNNDKYNYDNDNININDSIKGKKNGCNLRSYKSQKFIKFFDTKTKNKNKKNLVKMKDNNFYYKNLTQREYMGRTVTDGFGIKKIKNELFFGGHKYQ